MTKKKQTAPGLKAQQQAQQIILRAQQQAQIIRSRAQQQASQIRAQAVQNAARVREQTKHHVHYVGSHARVMGENAVRLFRINLANTLTLFNGVFGFLSMLASIQLQYFLAAIFILAGVLCDWLDGKAARAFGEESPLGAQLDSLSDLITFGVAPGILVVMITPSFFSFGAAALFVLSSALRLGRFNVQQIKGVYFGVPTTTNGLLLPVMIFLGFPTGVFAWYLVVMAFMMNVPLRVRKVF